MALIMPLLSKTVVHGAVAQRMQLRQPLHMKHAACSCTAAELDYLHSSKLLQQSSNA